MDYNKMLNDAIDEVIDNCGDSEHALFLRMYKSELIGSIKGQMNDNMVVFYQP